MKKIKTFLLILFLVYVGVLGYSFLKFSIFSKAFAKETTSSIKNQVQSLIDAKALATFDLMRDLALDPKLIRVMKEGNYTQIYRPNFFQFPKKYTDFSNVGLHVMDQNGINRYYSWTHKKLGEDIRKFRKDMRVFFAHPHAMHAISVGAFDMTFKGTTPLYTAQHIFVGAIEVITHFNSIAKTLTQSHIHSAVVIDQRFNAQLTHPFSPHVVDGYRISNRDLDPRIERVLKHYGVANLITINEVKDLDYTGGINDCLRCVSVPILGVDGKPIGWYLAFSEDRFHLGNIMAEARVMGLGELVLFVLMAFMTYFSYRKNDKFVAELNQKVEAKTQQNLELIYTDPLTGCYRKSRFDRDVLRHEGSHIVMINIRNFSKINEAYSFDIGDQVLRKIAQRMREVLSRDLYRIHADEFVFFTDAIKKDILILRHAFLEDPMKIEPMEVTLQPQFAVSVDTVRPGRAVLSELSIAMKSAKEQPHRIFVAYKRQKIDRSFLSINSALHAALYERNHSAIVPYFQPIIDNHTGTISHYEALARLKTPDRIFTPFQFMPVAQSSGYLHVLTREMIRTALEKFAPFAGTPTGLSLNITEEDLLLWSFDSYLMQECTRWGIAPEQITLEILEGVTASGARRRLKHLDRLHEMGFKIAIDDFGVEYSNFERISTMEIDLLKIDGKYIRDLVTNPRDYIIAKTITEFAHSLGIKVVAEFVEDAEIQAKVEELGIDYSQGYYFSKPHPTFTQVRT